MTTAATGPPAGRTGGTTRLRIARLVTDVASPAVLVAGLLFAIAWHAAPTAGQALAVGLVAAAAASFVPIGYIVRGVRRGRWTDRHVTVREQRRLPLLVCLASTLAGTVVLYAAGAPRPVVALIASMVAALAVTWPITMLARWKVSVHALVAAGTVAALGVVFGGPAALALCPVAVAVCWSRIALNDHTVGQVLVGALIGAAAAGLLFPGLA
ncbi:MAG TPA: phosphoesterase PA-phosphatase [Pilimelia sp.]|nr:phosphoesterase PA-phosphatase [Pilimelia sp.]